MPGKKSLRILVVDDDKDILDLLKYNLEKEGFAVRTLSKSLNAIPIVKRFAPGLIILDVMMPGLNGIDLCKMLRNLTTFEYTYIFFLTARPENYYQEAAFAIGADDYIEKLSGLRALTNKVIAVLKDDFIIRKAVAGLRSEDIIIHKRSGLVYFKNQRIILSKPEFEILFFLMQNSRRAVSLEDLIKIIWGSEIYVHHSSVQGYIENLQRKIGANQIESLTDNHYRFNQLISDF